MLMVIQKMCVEVYPVRKLDPSILKMSQKGCWLRLNGRLSRETFPYQSPRILINGSFLKWHCLPVPQVLSVNWQLCGDVSLQHCWTESTKRSETNNCYLAFYSPDLYQLEIDGMQGCYWVEHIAKMLVGCLLCSLPFLPKFSVFSKWFVDYKL